MENNIKDTLALISSMINCEQAGRGDFYAKMLDNIAGVIKSDFSGIYFIDSDSFIPKAQKGNNKDGIDNSLYEKIVQCDKNTVEFNNIFLGGREQSFVLVSKLLIRSSLYGIVLLARENKFSREEEASFEALVSVISYLIKDFELNDVFKMQLKALQDAIVEKNNAYEVIEKQHKKLLELDKTKNAFLANISHELRTPLNAIIGFSQALGCKIFGDLNTKQEEYVKDIQISGLHLLGMINEILDLSKIESKAMKISPCELDPGVAIQEAVNVLTPLFEQKSINVKFVNKCKKNIKADYQKLQQILYNLLSNAIKFTPEKGKIEIRISREGRDFILEVEDTGIGIDKKYHNKIFTKFVHLNNIYTKSQSSTGLGLTITKELVKLHKGKITLESTVNKGTTFKVLLKGAIA